jgi:hypothetical protein
VLERAVLAEHAGVGRHGKVSESLLGPGTQAAAGEVASSLLGPQVGCHHQSLVIATLWPAGRGNVAYGANVGCNHTSRAPDQECWAGEGVFFGLGVNVKFPLDLSRAPYAVVACGLTVPPQRVEFPFALLAEPAARPEGAPPGLQEITPAWGLAENLYALERCVAKFRARHQAGRSPFDPEVFRPEIVDLMLQAWRRLEALPEVRAVYTEREVPGLGKNFLRESVRRSAVAAYGFHVRLYALLGLLERVGAALSEDEPASALLAEPGRSARWEHQRQLLRDELGVTDAALALRELPGLLEQYARDVERSRGRDDRRGPRVIADYAEVHPSAGRDEVVRCCWERVRRQQAQARVVLAALTGVPADGPLPPHDLPADIAFPPCSNA